MINLSSCFNERILKMSPSGREKIKKVKSGWDYTLNSKMKLVPLPFCQQY